MKRIALLICSVLMAFGLFAQTSVDSIVVYDRNGQQVGFDEMLAGTAGKKYIMFGELHGNPLAHQSELLILQYLHQRHGAHLILGMEMFEADVQPIVDEYFSGLINQRSFETEARVWGNYAKDYKPLVEYARENKLRLVASNVPRRYANSVYHQGVQVLNNMPKKAKGHFAKLPLKIDWELESYKAMASMLPDHSAENFIASQALKDATMGQNINKNVKKNDVLLHVHGAYHSTNGEGIVPYIKGLRNEQLLLITTIQQEEGKTIDPAVFAKADFTIVSP